MQPTITSEFQRERLRLLESNKLKCNEIAKDAKLSLDEKESEITKLFHVNLILEAEIKSNAKVKATDVVNILKKGVDLSSFDLNAAEVVEEVVVKEAEKPKKKGFFNKK